MKAFARGRAGLRMGKFARSTASATRHQPSLGLAEGYNGLSTASRPLAMSKVSLSKASTSLAEGCLYLREGNVSLGNLLVALRNGLLGSSLQDF